MIKFLILWFFLFCIIFSVLTIFNHSTNKCGCKTLIVQELGDKNERN